MDLAQKVKTFPRKPGVYLFKGSKGEVLYVGKARRLRDRVRSYFVPGRDDRPQIVFLLRRTHAIDFIVTDTEKEALLLENTLIKEHRPRYNLSLRDDKSYVSIRVGNEHESPGIRLTRRIRKDGARYFGPYDSGLAAREAVESIHRFFRVRSCTDTEFANRVRPCLKYDIGRCTAPCVGKISAADYAEQVGEAEMFLSGQSRELLRRLSARMDAASEALRYEEAARLRDAAGMLRDLVEKQNVVRHGGGDRDAVGVAVLDRRVAICVLKVRGGTLVDKRIFEISDSAGDEAKLVEEFLLQRYRDAAETPPGIALSVRPEGLAAIADVLGEVRGGKVSLAVPSRGDMARLVELAVKNAREALIQRAGRGRDEEVLDRLGRRLGLSRAPDVIECIDISNLGGREAVGSVVVFVRGVPVKPSWRIYNIRTLETPDDYGMMREVLGRRFGVEGSQSARLAQRLSRPLPDLLLVDGEKGQLAVAKRIMEEMSLPVFVAAIAKGEKKGHADQVFVPGRKNPLKLKRRSPELLFLMRVRDEAHRFGIGAHRKRREKAALNK